MKTIVIISIISVLTILIFSMNTLAKTEKQKYKTLYQKGDFEIRFYPGANLATVQMSGDYDNMKNSGFRVLANYIFGGNLENKKIAMTAPVRMSNNGETSSMSFVMPSAYELDNLPTPQNKSVKLHQSKPKYVATIKFGGYANSQKIKQQEKQLDNILQNLEIKHKGNFEYLKKYYAEKEQKNRRPDDSQSKKPAP